jgi:signal transduction histidine kinase
VVQIWQRRVTHAQAIDILQLLKGLDLMESATRKMAVMIDDVLDVAQLQSGQELELNISQLDVVTLVQQVAAVLQASTTRHRIQIEEVVPHVVIFGDGVRLDRVITNVLTNAIKYSPRGGTITVNVSQEESGTSFFVRLPLEQLHPSERSIRSVEQTSSSSVEGSNRATRR